MRTAPTICVGCDGHMDDAVTGLGRTGTPADPKWRITDRRCVDCVGVEDLDALAVAVGRVDAETQRLIGRRLRKRYHPDVNRDPGAVDAFKRVNERFDQLDADRRNGRPSDPPRREEYRSDDPEWEAWKAANGFGEAPSPPATTPLDDLSDFIPEHMRHRQRDEFADVDTSMGGFFDALSADAADLKRRFDGFRRRLRDE